VNLNEGYEMNENEIKEFLNRVLPMLKELPNEEIIENINNIPDMSNEEREKFIQAILSLKEEENPLK
jgi:formate dehydrogenase maturation protein FdhE